ncbi:unnamed protein product, partial [Toxocara canis]|uniref:Uncharacterized protein n=1 Tax=Toxocara canis TaxID=6265 RepID=A0A183VHM9_TOXCA
MFSNSATEEAHFSIIVDVTQQRTNELIYYRSIGSAKISGHFILKLLMTKIELLLPLAHFSVIVDVTRQRTNELINCPKK